MCPKPYSIYLRGSIGVVAPFPQVAFVDMLSIDQTDPEQKELGIYSIGGHL